ncbi:HAMP domain-containing histidine kinase [Massilia sp. MB5]|uniref:sensor histidine kinase n=1 Tax=unclassified Massilia TaxID=2609279 RepID=UPI00067C772F|nr:MULTISPECIES: HAMP domain-containing sensor histidine kinase [unclassified Massilia]AKU23117.1 hypothetical protein ACZ75_18330 [Massilia sp. NR 4-1]UMR31996.1 HAMP domain-containing histidine kinase [Massilia sp. MB5]
MHRRRPWARPTLTRRIVVALLIAFVLVWSVFLCIEFVKARDVRHNDQELRDFSASMMGSISGLTTADEARAVANTTSIILNDYYDSIDVPGAVLLQLDARSGERLFLSPEAEGVRLKGMNGQIGNAIIHGLRYRVYRGESERWILTVAMPMPAPFWLLTSVGSDLVKDLLIAFPLVLLPIWIAVARGLRPLHLLSKRIAARGPDELSPLDINPNYADLLPLGQAINQLLAKLRRRIEREHNFVHDAAHELRTPLAVISVQAHALAAAPDEAQRRVAEQRLDHAISRASHLIAQLLEMAQADGSTARSASKVDVAELARQELALAAPAAMARQLELELDAPDTLPHTLDVPAFQAILQNLLRNAVHYTQEGGRIVVSLARNGGGLQLAVADNGPGIAPGEQELIFERFYRGSGGHDTPGSGLGLAIVKQAVARLAGNVRLSGGLDGRGCTFSVELPA